MNSTDQEKLAKAGFTILRPSHAGPVGNPKYVIRAMNKKHLNWYIFERGFSSQTAMKKRIHVYCEVSPMFVEE
jgi:hypothetical protein